MNDDMSQYSGVANSYKDFPCLPCVRCRVFLSGRLNKDYRLM